MVVEKRGIPSIAKEREILLCATKYSIKSGRKELHVDVILTKMSPSCSMVEWKKTIADQLNRGEKTFKLVTRTKSISNDHTLRHHGINPESVVYVETSY